MPLRVPAPFEIHNRSSHFFSQPGMGAASARRLGRGNCGRLRGVFSSAVGRATQDGVQYPAAKHARSGRRALHFHIPPILRRDLDDSAFTEGPPLNFAAARSGAERRSTSSGRHVVERDRSPHFQLSRWSSRLGFVRVDTVDCLFGFARVIADVFSSLRDTCHQLLHSLHFFRIARRARL